MSHTSHAIATGKSTEADTPRSNQSDRSEDASGARRLAPGEVAPEDPIVRIENLTAQQLLEEVGQIRVADDINATNIPFPQCLNFFAPQIF